SSAPSATCADAHRHPYRRIPMSVQLVSPGANSRHAQDTSKGNSAQEQLAPKDTPSLPAEVISSSALPAYCDCEICVSGSEKSIREHNPRVLFRECDRCFGSVPESSGR